MTKEVITLSMLKEWLDSNLPQLVETLVARGLASPEEGPIRMDGAEPRVDPMAFNLEALAETRAAAPVLSLIAYLTGA